MVKSVAVETQLAPAPMLPPMQQVIDTVQKLAASAEGSAPNAAPAVTVQTAAPGSSRTMTLVLEPENLGTVTIKMQLRGTNLDLQLDVADPQTLGMLTKDRDSLTAAMGGQDYTIGTLTMRASDTQTASQGSDNGTQNNAQGYGAQSGSSSSGDNAQGGDATANGGAFQGGGPGTGQRNPGRNRSAQTGEPDLGAPAASTSGVYI